MKRTSPAITFTVIVQRTSIQAGCLSGMSLPVEIIICQVLPVAKINFKVTSPWCLETWKMQELSASHKGHEKRNQTDPIENLVDDTLSMRPNALFYHKEAQAKLLYKVMRVFRVVLLDAKTFSSVFFSLLAC